MNDADRWLAAVASTDKRMAVREIATAVLVELDRLRDALRSIADLECTNYNSPWRCPRVPGPRDQTCGPCTARAVLSSPSHDMLQSDS